MLHNNSSLIAISTIPNPTIFEKTLGVNDFYYGESEWAYPLGATQMLGKSDAFTISLDAPNADDPADLAAHPRFWLTTEPTTHPRTRSRLRLHTVPLPTTATRSAAVSVLPRTR
jgi:hypothetical protein